MTGEHDRGGHMFTLTSGLGIDFCGDLLAILFIAL